MPRPRLKRLLQVSLRMVLVGTTILCIWLGVKVQHVNEQKRAVELVKKHGGVVLYDYNCNGWTLKEDADPPGPNWLVDMIGVDFFATPEVLTFSSEFSDPVRLTGLTKLRMIVLWHHVTGEEVAEFRRVFPDCELAVTY